MWSLARAQAVALLRPACSRLWGRTRLIGTAPGPAAFPSQKHAPLGSPGAGGTPRGQSGSPGYGQRGCGQPPKPRQEGGRAEGGAPVQATWPKLARRHQHRAEAGRGAGVETPTGQVPLAPPHPAWPPPRHRVLAGSARCLQSGQGPWAHLAPPPATSHSRALSQVLLGALTLHVGVPLTRSPPAAETRWVPGQALFQKTAASGPGRRGLPAHALTNPSPRPPRPGAAHIPPGIPWSRAPA